MTVSLQCPIAPTRERSTGVRAQPPAVDKCSAPQSAPIIKRKSKLKSVQCNTNIAKCGKQYSVLATAITATPKHGETMAVGCIAVECGQCSVTLRFLMLIMMRHCCMLSKKQTISSTTTKHQRQQQQKWN